MDLSSYKTRLVNQNKFLDFQLNNIAKNPRSYFFVILNNLEFFLSKYDHLELQSLEKVINTCYEFIWTSDISVWQKVHNEIRPYSILDEHPSALDDFEYIDREFAISLKKEYLQLPKFWIKSFDNLFWMAFDSIVGDEKSCRKIFIETFEVLKKEI